MSESDHVLYSQLVYYSRQGYFNHVQRLADDNLKNFVNDPVLQFFYAYSQLMQGQNQESIRALLTITDHPDVSVGAILCMIQAHKTGLNVDKEAVTQFENKLRDERKTATDKSCYYGGLFLFLNGSYDRAREFIDRALKQQSSNPMYLCLKGWNDLHSGRDIKSALKSFEDAIAEMRGTEVYLDAHLGQAKYQEMRQNRNGMAESLNLAAAKHPNFLPIHIERMKAEMMARDWEQCVEVAQRCQVIDPSCVEAWKYLTLHALCFEAGNILDTENLLTELVDSLDKTEPKNAKLRLSMARLFSRMCGRKQEIMQHTKSLCEKALSLQKDAEAQAELGRQLRMMGQIKLSIKAYKQSLEMENSTADTMLGIVHCYLLENNLSEAEGQIEFVKAAQQDVGKSGTLEYLETLIAKRKEKPRQEVVQRLTTILDRHFGKLQLVPFGAEYFLKLDPDFVLEVVNELFDYVPIEPAKSGQLADPLFKEIQRILTVVTEAAPGVVEASYLLGKAKYLAGDTDGAQAVLQHCLAKDQTFSEGHLLMAQIYLQKSNFKMASQSLEVGLSYNFQVRDHPLYHLIKSRIQKRSNNIEAAVHQLESAMTLPGFKRTAPGAETQGGKKPKMKLELTEADRVAIYLELIDCLQALERTAEASKLMQEALAEFRGTKQEERLIVCNADLALARGDADGALTLLNAVTPDQPNYLAARQKIAEIYLHHKKDKRQFAICYKELVDNNPTPQAFVLLGDAYMSIQEPERAIDVYEAAMKRNPKDHALARKIGQAYVQAHLYSKAVNYYEAALKTGQQNFLRQDLAELLFRLRNFEKCEKVLKQGLEKHVGGSDIMALIDEVKFLELLSKLHFETGNWQQAIEKLTQAKDQQSRILKRNPSEVPDFQEQRNRAAALCCQLGQFHENQREQNKAIQYFKEAMNYSENDSKIMLALAHLYLSTGDLDECNQQCQILLKIDKDNDQATLMLADLMYQRNEIDSAMFHFQQLLDRNPNQYHALARLVELSWRNGDVDQGEKYIKTAMDRNPRATLEPGFNYCKGLYEWYTGDPNAALQLFNRARRDLEWGERSIYDMIEICLNPDNEIIGGEVFDHGLGETETMADRQDQREMGVRTAERFLKELRFKPGLDYKYRLMENFILLATKNRASIDEAITNFATMAGGEGDEEVTNIGAILGLARGYMILKQTPKAKTQLKRIVNHPWTLEDADYLEQCWLLLADTYINQGKYDAATGVLRTCLQHNSSCSKAFEYMGFLKEKDQKYMEASSNYEEAWKLSKRRNPTLGYKLAYNYLKSKRLVDAIDACHRVLDLYPNYPKIRRDILDKARASLRT